MGQWVLWNGWIFICREKYQFGFFNFFGCHFCFHEYFRTCDILISHYISFLSMSSLQIFASLCPFLFFIIVRIILLHSLWQSWQSLNTLIKYYKIPSKINRMQKMIKFRSQHTGSILFTRTYKDTCM